MLTLFSALVAVVFYCTAACRQMLSLTRRLPLHQGLVNAASALAVIGHGIVVYTTLRAHEGLHLGISETVSLVFFLIATLLLLASIKKPLMPAAVGLYPLAALSVIGAVGFPESSIEYGFTPGMLTHIATSVLAYALLIMAAGQAVLLAVQTHALKHNHLRGIIQVLPPLTTMERLMFELIIYGMVFLTASIISGFLFINDLFARHLVHKTVLSLLAWVLFSILLWGRYQRGWRGLWAIRWTLGAVIVLILAYFGTRLIVQLLHG